MSETIKVTKEIPKPPEGWQWEDRLPKNGEERLVWNFDLVINDWVWSNYKGYIPKDCSPMSFAYRIPKKKRLMTPQELAGKWLRGKSGDILFVRGANDTIGTVSYDPQKWTTISNLHLLGWLFSDTPTSEPKSLEVEEND